MAGWPVTWGCSEAWGSQEIQVTQESLLHVEPQFSHLSSGQHHPHLKGSGQLGEKVPKGLTRAWCPRGPQEGPSKEPRPRAEGRRVGLALGHPLGWA